MPDQAYVDLIDNQPSNWTSRVKGVILRYANSDAIKAAPTVAQGPADALGRAVVVDPDYWAGRFKNLLAVQLIGEPSLTDADVTDADLFSATAAVWPKFFDQPTPTG